MYSEEQMKEIVRLVNICKGLEDAEVYVYNADTVFGIEYEGYQTFKLRVEPVFDMPEQEIAALVNLMARALPIAKHLIEENNTQAAKIEALMDCIATISVIGSERMQRVSNIRIVEEEEDMNPQTVGEK